MSKTNQEVKDKIANAEVENTTDANAVLEELKTLKEEIANERELLKAERESLKEDKAAIAKALEAQKADVVISKEDKQADINEAKRTAEKLKENMVKTKIPVDPMNPKDLYIPVTINGYTWIIKRGETVEIPEAVAKILEDAKYI